MAEVGVTFPLTDPATGREHIGWGRTLDAAIADAIHQVNEATRLRLRVARVVLRFKEDADA
jgi:hypothetical protein